MLKFKGYWLKEGYDGMEKHTRVQVVSFSYLSKDLEFVERADFVICGTPKGLREVPKYLVELVPWDVD